MDDARYAARVVAGGEFLELAGRIEDEDATHFLVGSGNVFDAEMEIVAKGDGWQSLTSLEVFDFGTMIGDEQLTS
jgi:hypothetical protein